MDICEHIINILASVIAVEYMERGLEKNIADGGIGFCLQEDAPSISPW